MITEARRQSLKFFAQGREFYKKQDFVTALKYFNEAHQADETDNVADVFVARCKYYIENPPDKGWDGVFEMKTK